ncbi:MgtC/SapB family protein [Paraflavitalea sp. CAU 1676]|uniref:MgtC/SapB family protein n=1 Tax=Paraflavitalea sp. CAU 1676 TaxID=3032598 RepID=UPI0023DC498D|nr:MgtC/SapB family protein [Paraflavitalea sp. CAU 1676]MDF2189933.1 MgtC/SapB family protein [Paraflavitalea sp. CAU 1676]
MVLFSWDTALLRIGLAILLGGIIGAEREYHDKSAGLRTITLICVGSCLFCIVSQLLTNGTADRIASTVVTGIGFLGAGVIFRSEQGVNGLTTAATVWTTAAIGMAVGSGLYLIAAGTTVSVLVVLSIFIKLEPIIDTIHKERNYIIVCDSVPDVLIRFNRMYTECRLRCSRQKRTKKGNELHLLLKLKGTKVNQDRFVDMMLKDDAIKGFEY